MKDEIKEILEDLKEDVEQNVLIEVRGNVFKPLLDYITNLQEEIKRLNNLVSKYDKELKHKTEQYEYLRHYNNSDNIINEIDRKLCSTWQLYYDHSRLTTFKCEDMLYLIEQIRKDIEKLKGSDK